MEQKHESSMFGYLCDMTNQLCGMDPQGREEVEGHAETLKTFSNLIQDAMDKNPEDQRKKYGGLLMIVYARIEGLMKKRRSYLDASENQETEELLIDELNMEICGVIQKLANLELEVSRMQKKLEHSSDKKFRCLLGEDLDRLRSMIGNVELCAGGVTLRIESAMKGYFE